MASGPPNVKRKRTDFDEEDGTEPSTRNTATELKSCTSNSSGSSPNIVSVSRSFTPSASLTHRDSHKQTPSTDRKVLSPSPIPEKLSDWTRKIIEDLSIKVEFQPETRPFDLLTRPPPCTGGLGIRLSVYDVERIQKCQGEKSKKVSFLAEFVKRSGFIDMIQNLNYTAFQGLNIDMLHKLNSYKDRCFLPSFGLPCELAPWFRRFDTYGKSFMYVLSRMVENVIQAVPNSKHQYRHLFDTLVKMFGMESGISFEHGLPEQTLQMGNVEVKGFEPDIIYAHHRINGFENKLETPRIVVICEVMEDKPVSSCIDVSPPNSNTKGKTIGANNPEVSSTTAKKEQVHKTVSRLSEKNIGQHCGKLLFKHDQSIDYNSVFGIVVQQTQVTFTELGMTDTQYQKIKRGKVTLVDGERPTFSYTRPYDFLKKEELEVLIEPFIKFGIEQDQ